MLSNYVFRVVLDSTKYSTSIIVKSSTRRALQMYFLILELDPRKKVLETRRSNIRLDPMLKNLIPYHETF